MMNGSQYWHYTTAHRLRSILNEGYIRRASAGVPRGERRAVWFTRRDTWEPTATKLVITPDRSIRRATVSEMHDRYGALVRVAVDASVARYSWDHHRRFGRIHPGIADGLERSAALRGSDPVDWRLSYRDVPATQILTIEKSTDGVTWSPAKQVPDGWVLQSPDHDEERDLPRVS